MIGRTLGHYRIVEKIDEGGMGEVYRARDEHLNRDVAVKVLPPGTLADDAARKRFHKEALALSKLNHPNIATVHDFDTQDGVDFLVMEHIAGVTMAEKLASGPLPEQEVARLGTEVAAALEEAHEHGVVHRDLKPGNIKVTPKGQVKVLDFGLARLLKPFSETGSTESLTETHALAGTLPYMAPEQLRGQPADPRSDIWALGVVLYEAATGERPFQGGSGAELSAAILRERPRAWPPRVPAHLQQVIERCLEKEPGRRYQRAGEVRAALEAVHSGTAPVPWRPWVRRLTRRQFLGTAGALAVLAAVLVALNVGGVRDRLFGSTPRIDSIAVLPLKNLMGDPEQDYFVEGMHEALTAELSKISVLKVISRTSAMRYKDTDKAMPQIARELGVSGLIEGSVLREGDQVRITVQLIHGPSDRHLWADSYQREMRGILALHSDVARAVAREIRIAVTPAEEARLASSRAVDPEAHRHYLLGRFHSNRRTPEGFKKAAEHFQQAIDLDPRYALAYAGLADNFAVQPSWATLSPEEAYPRAKAAAQRALEIDDSLAEAHATLGYVLLFYEWDWEGAERAYRRALELNANSATAHYRYAWYLAILGRHEEAIARIKRAQELDPLSLFVGTSVGWMYYFARRYNEAEEVARKALEMDSNFAMVHDNLGSIYLAAGRPHEALAAFHRARALVPASSEYLGGLALAYVRTGKREEGRSLLRQLENESKETYVPATYIAVTYAHLGEKDRALRWLEKALEQRDPHALLMKVGPDFDVLRSDPRFQALLRRMNFPE